MREDRGPRCRRGCRNLSLLRTRGQSFPNPLQAPHAWVVRARLRPWGGVLSNRVLSSGVLSSGMLNNGLSSSGVLSSGGLRDGVSSRNVQSSDNRKIQGLRDDQVHIDPTPEIVKTPGACGLWALGLRVRGLHALGLRAGRLCAGCLHACIAHARGLRGHGHRALVQRD